MAASSCPLWLRVYLFLCVFSVSAAAQEADLVLRGGVILTLDNNRPQAEAIAARGQRIVAIGSMAEVNHLIGTRTRVIDLAGRIAMPGFIEGHGHFLSLGDSKRKLDLARAKTWEEIEGLVAEVAKKVPPGQWIVGRGWHQGKWNKAPEPNVQGYPPL